MDLRKALYTKVTALDEIDSEHFPIVSLDEFFLGNEEEDSIAPNQWGDGRPSIRVIYERFKAIEARPDVQGVYVSIHQDWPDAEGFEQWVPADSIHVYSSAPQHVADEWIEGLFADGISPGWPYGKHAAAPEPMDGYHVYTVYWD
ncbi:hypothetical protein C7S18_06000 [Ahniella affigens]|uniref:Uncharacterized protein n=1 Tax=Ahniella affigens TaxID=2021234 RepID=A0A2P1PPM4_9GAMM|nr:hypothetical protein [Ahniella affigens]AVP96778.1 hypothetical protein C7S18_06000 [Ahniella affigens]